MPSTFRSSVSIVYSILWTYNRRGELLRLARWARNRQLDKPLHLYRTRWHDEDIRLSRYIRHHPHLSRLAYIIHLMNSLFFPPPSYPRRGAASGYTRRAMIEKQRRLGRPA